MLHIDSTGVTVRRSRHSHSESESSFLDAHTNALLRITSAIEIATTLDELLLLALGETAQFIEVPRSGIVLLREDTHSAQLVGTYPPRVTLPPPVNVDQTAYVQHVIENRQSQQIYDVNTEPATIEVDCLISDEGLSSLLLVPLVAQDKAIGVLLLGTLDTPRHFNDTEIALVRALIGPLAAAVSAFQTREAFRRRNAELATLNDIANAVTSSLDARQVYHTVVKQLNEYFRVDAGSLLMRDEETGELEFVMTMEGGEEKLAGVRLPRGRGVAGHVAETQHYEIVHDPRNDPRFYSKISESTGYVTHSILCVPMLIKGRTVGVIELLNKREGEFTHEDATRLMRMATTIGIALENARLFQQVVTGRDQLKALINSTNDGILMADMHSIVQTANPTAASVFQMPEDMMIGQHIDDLLHLLHSRSRNITTPSWLNEDTQDSAISAVYELELRGNRHRCIRHFALPVRDTEQVQIGQLVLLQDVSKERELAQLRDDFTGMLVHDLRAPITTIMNGISMMRRGLGGPVSEQQTNLLNVSYKSSQAMLEMVNTLLDISKMEQGSMPLNYEPISPYDLVDEPLKRLRVLAEEHHIHLNEQLPLDLPLIEADREKVVRVLQNLLDNAIKFSPSNSAVTLGVAHVQTNESGVQQYTHTETAALPVRLPNLPADNWMVFWVHDEGTGIPSQYHDRIFEKFGQINNRKMRGTGLGLTFCKLAVESHGGRIWLESMEGEGSTFALVLPLTHD